MHSIRECFENHEYFRVFTKLLPQTNCEYILNALRSSTLFEVIEAYPLLMK